jgi:Domain of unknown function (DUF6531)
MQVISIRRIRRSDGNRLEQVLIQGGGYRITLLSRHRDSTIPSYHVVRFATGGTAEQTKVSTDRKQQSHSVGSPNYVGLPAGSVVNFWNDDPIHGGWQVYGHGKVSANGKQVIADESVGFRQLMSFSFGLQLGPTRGAAPNPGPNPGGCRVKGGDPVDCATGLFLHTVTDLVVNDVMSISVTRVYRTTPGEIHLHPEGDLPIQVSRSSQQTPTGLPGPRHGAIGGSA